MKLLLICAVLALTGQHGGVNAGIRWYMNGAACELGNERCEELRGLHCDREEEVCKCAEDFQQWDPKAKRQTILPPGVFRPVMDAEVLGACRSKKGGECGTRPHLTDLACMTGLNCVNGSCDK